MTQGVVDGQANFVLMQVDALTKLKGRIDGLKKRLLMPVDCIRPLKRRGVFSQRKGMYNKRRLPIGKANAKTFKC